MKDDLDFAGLCKEIEKREKISQGELARRMGLAPAALCHVLKGRRPLPAEAAIELFDITGIHPKKILQASMKIAASVMLAVVILFLTPPENAQAKSAGYDTAAGQSKHYAQS